MAVACRAAVDGDLGHRRCAGAGDIGVALACGMAVALACGTGVAVPLIFTVVLSLSIFTLTT